MFSRSIKAAFGRLFFWRERAVRAPPIILKD
jgi:hypothetical protein